MYKTLGTECKMMLHVSQLTDTIDNEWHYKGHKSVFGHLPSAELLGLFKEKLPQRDLPIKNNHTGYIHLESEASIADIPNGWCYEKHGRVVVIFDKYIMFQRMMDGDIIAISEDGISYDQLRGKQLEEITSMISNQ